MCQGRPVGREDDEAESRDDSEIGEKRDQPAGASHELRLALYVVKALRHQDRIVCVVFSFAPPAQLESFFLRCFFFAHTTLIPPI